MKKLLLSLLIMLSGAANAATFLAIPEDGVKIFVDNKQSCSEKSAAEVAKLDPPAELKWMAAKVEVKGEQFVACATEANGSILLVYEDGDKGIVPVKLFHMVRDV